MKTHRKRVRGFSLIELMVAVVIGMVLILAITQMTVRQDGIRRSVTGINDVALASGYASATLDRDLRSAGSGFAQAWRGLYGCTLRVARNGAQILPRPSAFPVPFEEVAGDVRGAPVLIHAGAGPDESDVLQILAGSSGLAEISANALPNSATTDAIRLPNTLGVQGGDLLLISEEARGCMVQQVEAGFAGGVAELIKFGGAFAAGSVDGLGLSSFSQANVTDVSKLGNAGNNPPRFQLLGRNEDGLLLSYDLLRIDGQDSPQVVGEGVVALRALYGVDTNDDGRVDSWVAPTGADYSVAGLTDGTLAAQTRLRRILAIRVGLLLRGDLLERTSVSPPEITLFGDLPGLEFTRALSENEQRLRVRPYEFTVPLRNAMISLRSP